MATTICTRTLAEMLEHHGVRCTLEGESWLEVPARDVRGQAALIDREDAAGGGKLTLVQLDVVFVGASSRPLIESCAGFGVDRNEAEKDAWTNFARSSFHVLLSALFGVTDREQVACEEWTAARQLRNSWRVCRHAGARGRLRELREAIVHGCSSS